MSVIKINTGTQANPVYTAVNTLPTASDTILGGVKINGNNLTIDPDGTLHAQGGSSRSIGEIAMFASSTIPSNFLPCNGDSLLRTGTYASLFAVIGTTFGSVDSTHFNLPNLTDKFIMGVGAKTVGQEATGSVGSHNHNAGTLSGSVSYTANNTILTFQGTGLFGFRPGAPGSGAEEGIEVSTGIGPSSQIQLTSNTGHSHTVSISGSTSNNIGTKTIPTDNIALVFAICAL